MTLKNFVQEAHQILLREITERMADQQEEKNSFIMH